MASVAVVIACGGAWAQYDGVSSTIHNLSLSGPGEIKALNEEQVCKFCHIPHSAVVSVPLWGQQLSNAQYKMPEMRSGQSRASAVPQPNGSSRLCLSCHDGTVALGKIGRGSQKVLMMGSDLLTPGSRGFVGTDLSGSHPISFVYPSEGEIAATDTASDMGLRSRSQVEMDTEVKLDSAGRMQCTTCHDPHSDRNFQPGSVPHFWRKRSVDDVCLSCHEVR